MPAVHDDITIVVPAKDEAPTIQAVVASCRRWTRDIIVVDGHSTDETAALARDAGARVLYDGGRGKGDAIRTAILAPVSASSAAGRRE